MYNYYRHSRFKTNNSSNTVHFAMKIVKISMQNFVLRNFLRTTPVQRNLPDYDMEIPPILSLTLTISVKFCTLFGSVNFYQSVASCERMGNSLDSYSSVWEIIVNAKAHRLTYHGYNHNQFYVRMKYIRYTSHIYFYGFLIAQYLLYKMRVIANTWVKYWPGNNCEKNIDINH